MQLDKQYFETPAYNFLRNNTDLEFVIYLTLSGSRGYGTQTENSDVDLRGVLVEPPSYLYGLSSFEQFENQTTDTVIYGLKKFVSLCVNANPNALELLGTQEESIVYTSPAGNLLRENAHLFLTQRVIDSFGHYATSQLRRLSNALCHDRYPLLEQEQHLANTLNGQILHFNNTYSNLGPKGMQMYLNKENDLVFDLTLISYPVRDFVGIYSEMNSTIKTYGKLNHRSRKKDEAHLYKHAMHLIRLLITGTDILNNKGILTKRIEEHQLLMDIRHGEYSFEEIINLSNTYRSLFEKAAATTKLPVYPDIKAIEALMTNIYGITIGTGY